MPTLGYLTEKTVPALNSSTIIFPTASNKLKSSTVFQKILQFECFNSNLNAYQFGIFLPLKKSQDKIDIKFIFSHSISQFYRITSQLIFFFSESDNELLNLPAHKWLRKRWKEFLHEKKNSLTQLEVKKHAEISNKKWCKINNWRWKEKKLKIKFKLRKTNFIV